MRRTQLKPDLLVLLALPLLLLVPLGASGTARAPAEPDDGLDVFFRDQDLGALARQELPVYGDEDPGDAERLAPAFYGAPPQVPHRIDDLPPLTVKANECLSCHHPDGIKKKKTKMKKRMVPMPKSHFQRPVMAKGKKKDPMVWVVKKYKKQKAVAGTHWQCTMCHAPQANNVKTPDTSFVGLPK